MLSVMKILNVMFTTRLGGLEQAFLDYNEALKLAKIEVVSIVHSDSPLLPISTNKNYKIFNFSKHDPIALFKLQRLVKREEPDLIITHGNRAHYMMKKAAGKIPVVGVLHTFSFNHIKNCDYVISVSDAMRRELIISGYPENRSSVIPNMIRLPSNMKYVTPDISSIPVIGLMTRIEKIKGVDIFIKALELLKSQNIEFKAKIAGIGSEYENVEKLIIELGLEKNIQMLGWVKDKEAFYKQIDILTVPSREEPFGIVILEGFFNSKPVIVSNVSGPMEIVENYKDALVFDNENYVELSELLIKMLSNKELTKKLTENGFNKVKLYDINVISKKILTLLNELYDKKSF